MYLSLSVRTKQDGGFCTVRWVFVCCIHRRDSRLRPLVFLGTTRRTRGLGCGYRCGYFLRAPTTGLVRIGWFRHCFQHHTLVPTKCMLAHYIFVMFLCYIRLRASGASWGNPGLRVRDWLPTNMELARIYRLAQTYVRYLHVNIKT